MNEVVQIECEFGTIQGYFISTGISIEFKGKLTKGNNDELSIQFLIPYSFIEAYGKQEVLDQIKNSVVGYIKTDPKNYEYIE
jgi:hypothetical protein